MRDSYLSYVIMNTIDLFGRAMMSMTDEAMAATKRGPRGYGFKLTPEGNFDVENRRITNVGAPINDNDLVTKRSVLMLSDSDEGVIDVKKRRLVHVKEPLDNHDVCTKKYTDELVDDVERKLLSNCLRRRREDKGQGSYYDAKDGRICNIGEPLEDKDVISRQYFNNRAMHTNDQMQFNADGKRIVSVSYPIDGTDVTSKAYVDAQFDSAVQTFITMTTDTQNTIKDLKQKVTKVDIETSKLNSLLTTLEKETKRNHLIANDEMETNHSSVLTKIEETNNTLDSNYKKLLDKVQVLEDTQKVMRSSFDALIAESATRTNSYNIKRVYNTD